MAASSAALRTWLESNGTIIHPSVEIKQDADFGLSTWATDSLPAESTVLSLPFELAVTPERAEAAIVGVLPAGRGEGEAAVEQLEERIKVLVYLVLHWIGEDQTDVVDSTSPLLGHYPYLHSLPSQDSLFTPLYFSSAERDLLEGTSVSGAAREMEATWRQDHERVGRVLGLTVKDGFTWERYLLASTYLSSRAFPSRLLHLPTPEDPTPSTDSHPILLPGIDLLNHQPLHPVSWISSPATATPSSTSSAASASNSSPSASSSAGRIAVILPSPTPAGEQVWNNYGGKPNDELLLAYTLPHTTQTPPRKRRRDVRKVVQNSPSSTSFRLLPSAHARPVPFTPTSSHRTSRSARKPSSPSFQRYPSRPNPSSLAPVRARGERVSSR